VPQPPSQYARIDAERRRLSLAEGSVDSEASTKLVRHRLLNVRICVLVAVRSTGRKIHQRRVQALSCRLLPGCCISAKAASVSTTKFRLQRVMLRCIIKNST